jgi:subtilisin family serine protease
MPTDIDEKILQHHNAKYVPGTDTAAEPPYRNDALLIPTPRLDADPTVIDRLNSALDGVGLGRPLVVADRGGLVTLLRVTNGDAAALRERLTGLATQAVWSDDTVPDTIRSIDFDHVVVTGLPVSKGFGTTVGRFPWERSRVPLSVAAPAPCRRSLAELGTGRRPVVAMLDTTVQEHPWLARVPAGDPVVADPVGWAPDPPDEAPSPEGTGLTADDQLTTHAGHGTFVAGLLRQAAPDARILPFDIMHSDGAVYENVLYRALEWICDGVDSGDPARFVDVLCLPFGYTVQDSADSSFTQRLHLLLSRLEGRGVRVVAAAGNQGEDIPTYPAAFAASEPPAPVPVLSVGACNPNGTHAAYSNWGHWVTDWAPGTGLVSTMPTTFNAADSPQPGALREDGTQSYGLDADDFRGGFGLWSGTSFAAAVLAGRLAQALMPGQAEAPANLLDVAPEAAVDRATRAYTRISDRL